MMTIVLIKENYNKSLSLLLSILITILIYLFVDMILECSMQESAIFLDHISREIMWGIEAFLRIQCKFNAIPASIVEKGQYVQFKIDGLCVPLSCFLVNQICQKHKENS